MPGGQDHCQLRVDIEELGPRLKQRRFLAFERAACDDESQTRRRRLEQPRGFGLLRGTHIELEISRHCNALRRAADRDQALGVGLALRKNCAQPFQQRTPQAAQHFVARPGAIGDACVDHRYGNSAAKASVEQIRPELSLRQHQHARLERVEIRAHRPGQIERAIKYAVGSEAFAGQSLSGARGGGNGYEIFRQRRIERLHEARDGQHLAHADRVQPDQRPAACARASEQLPWDAPQPFPQALAVFLGRRHAP